MGNAVPQTQCPNAKAPSLAAEFIDLGRALRGMLDPYRPERHYMRGPGPKWYAKNNPAPTIADSGVALQLSAQTITRVTGATVNCPA